MRAVFALALLLSCSSIACLADSPTEERQQGADAVGTAAGSAKACVLSFDCPLGEQCRASGRRSTCLRVDR